MSTRGMIPLTARTLLASNALARTIQCGSGMWAPLSEYEQATRHFDQMDQEWFQWLEEADKRPALALWESLTLR